MITILQPTQALARQFPAVLQLAIIATRNLTTGGV